MPIPLTALLAATLHQVRLAEADPAALARAAELLAAAARGTAPSWAVDGDTLLALDTPVPAGAPGATTVRAALRAHRVARLSLPSGISATQWSDLAVLLASATALYPEPDQFRAAIRAIIPAADVVPADPAEMGEELEAALADLQGAVPRPAAEGVSDNPAVTSSAGERSELSVLLDPLLKAGTAAVARWDWAAIADVMLGMHALEERAAEGERWAITQERHRVISPDVLKRLASHLPEVGPGSPLVRALTATGRDAVEAILELLMEQPGRQARHAYLEALTLARDAEPALLEALQATPAAFLADVIEVIGRRRVERAIPALARFRQHDSGDVRAAAMRALEQIGTPDAIRALR